MESTRWSPASTSATPAGAAPSWHAAAHSQHRLPAREIIPHRVTLSNYCSAMMAARSPPGGGPFSVLGSGLADPPSMSPAPVWRPPLLRRNGEGKLSPRRAHPRCPKPSGRVQHKTVCHARGEYARDEDDEGFCEIHVNTMEGTGPCC